MLSGMENDKQAAIRRINGLLKEKLPLLAPLPGIIPTAIEGVSIYRIHGDTVIDCFAEPCIGVVIQGNKRAVAADEEYRYSEGRYIAYGLDLPAITHIMGATPEKPHLALSIPLDRYILTQLAPEIPPAPAADTEVYRGVMTAEVSADLLDACLRLVGLLETPERIPVFAPMVIREIHYFLLTGPGGGFFRLLGTHQTVNSQIALAVSWLRAHYQEPFNLSGLVGQVNMSRASFCRHFSRITGISPLQFQKRLRLYEAQRLMLTEDKSAETAAYEVGYESPTQFNREYKRQFGEPPHRDVQKMITAGVALGEEIM
jgi:AraC-like DNA-binding protein